LLIAASSGIACGFVVRVRVGRFGPAGEGPGTTADEALIRPPADAAPSERLAGRLPPGSVELVTATLFVLAAWRFGLDARLAVQLAFLVAAVELSILDLRHRLLPNATVLPALLLCTGLAVTAALLAGRPEQLLQAGLGAGGLFLLYLLLALISPASLGMGDVKLAALIGLVLGLSGWQSWFVGTFWGFLAGAVAALGVVIFRRGGRRTTLPFGPAMLAGATAAILLT
ncbi:MAG: peptidase, partial [Micrococcaceae bacterium]|nr:peptidase [Micrococcaceae bacterium]